jgi:hypothetical protein
MYKGLTPTKLLGEARQGAACKLLLLLPTPLLHYWKFNKNLHNVERELS